MDIFCGHFLWTLFVNTFSEFLLSTLFVDTFCGHFLWTLFVDTFSTLFVNSFLLTLFWYNKLFSQNNGK